MCGISAFTILSDCIYSFSRAGHRLPAFSRHTITVANLSHRVAILSPVDEPSLTTRPRSEPSLRSRGFPALHDASPACEGSAPAAPGHGCLADGNVDRPLQASTPRSNRRDRLLRNLRTIQRATRRAGTISTESPRSCLQRRTPNTSRRHSHGFTVPTIHLSRAPQAASHR